MMRKPAVNTSTCAKRFLLSGEFLTAGRSSRIQTRHHAAVAVGFAPLHGWLFRGCQKQLSHRAAPLGG